MTTTEARARISEEFMSRFHEWLDDYAEMPDMEYGRKYGWAKNPEVEAKNDMKSLIRFQKYIFSGLWDYQWVKLGYEQRTLWELKKEGFLSYQMYSNWEARATGKTDFYYISQKTAKEIYKASKA